MSEFVSAAPPSGGIKFDDYKGSLLIVEPLSLESGIQTAFGTADAVKANVYALTGADTSDDYEECLIFPKVLAGQLRSQIGKKVVGRLGQGTAKPGQSAPWVLDPATPEDIEKAQAWMAKRATPTVTSAAPPF